MPESQRADEIEVPLKPGTHVEVRSRFDRGWKRGFEIAEVIDSGGYRVRRLSDGAVLPVPFDVEDVRRTQRRGTWWY